MKKYFTLFLTLLAIFSLIGCSKEPEINEHALSVIEILMTAPNEDFYSPVTMGAGVSKEETAKQNEAAATADENLRKALEPHIAENFYDSFMGNGPDAIYFLASADLMQISMVPEVTLLKEESKDCQVLTVTLEINEERTVAFNATFDYSDDGKVEVIRIDADLSELNNQLAGK